MSMRFALAFFVGASSLVGCGGQTQTGLSNAPALNRPPSPEDRGHDVIANGSEACAPGPGGERKVKLPQCAESAEPAASARPGAK